MRCGEMKVGTSSNPVIWADLDVRRRIWRDCDPPDTEVAGFVCTGIGDG